MLSNTDRQRYQDFKQALEELQLRVLQANPDRVALQEASGRVQQLFQERIASLSAEQIDPQIASRWQSIQTETHKQMRLLLMDVKFLQASRQATTSQQRIGQIGDRLQTLINYCNLLLHGEWGIGNGNGTLNN